MISCDLLGEDEWLKGVRYLLSLKVREVVVRCLVSGRRWLLLLLLLLGPKLRCLPSEVRVVVWGLSTCCSFACSPKSVGLDWNLLLSASPSVQGKLVKCQLRAVFVGKRERFCTTSADGPCSANGLRRVKQASVLGLDKWFSLTLLKRQRKMESWQLSMTVVRLWTV